MTAKEAAEQIINKHIPTSQGSWFKKTSLWPRIVAAIQEALEVGATWKEEQFKKLSMWEQTETVASNGAEGVKLFGEPRNTTPLKTEAANKVISLSKQPNEVEQLQQRIKELEEREGKFAEWASKNEWKFGSSYYPGKWFKIVSVDKDGMTYTGQRKVIHKTTAELWAEWDRCGSI